MASRFSSLTLHDVLNAADHLDANPAKPTKYMAIVSGRFYPSKALLARAAGVSPKTFSGGFACTIPVLQRLGVVIMEGNKVVVERKVKDAARKVAKSVSPRSAPVLPEGATWYLSGTNREGEIAGAASQGHAIGCCVQELSMSGIDALKALADTGIQVFVDSGAFSEVRFGDAGVEVVREITDAKWQQILSVYEDLASALGSQLTVVAPDRVGDQEITFQRLCRYAGRLQSIAAHGAQIMVAVQKGAMAQSTFFFAARDGSLACIPPSSIVAGLPCNKAATTPAEAAEFRTKYHDSRIHLLGVGPRSRAFPEYVAAMAGTTFSCDSAWIPSASGRTNGRGNGPRAFTQAKDAAKLLLGVAAPAFLIAQTALSAALSVAV